MTRSLLALGLAALALLLAASAGAATTRDLVIRPGVGIGKVRLGMSLAQVRAAMGRADSAITTRHGRGPRRLELQYDFAAYSVTLVGSPGRERVVSVATTLAKERTRQGIGVRSFESRLRRAFRGLRCDRLDVVFLPFSSMPVVGTNRRDCTVGGRDEAQTVFSSRVPTEIGGWHHPDRWPSLARVYEVAVRAPGA